MAIPIFEDFLYPFLLATNGKDMTVSEMREYIIDYFKLGASVSSSCFDDRITTARSLSHHSAR